MKWGIGRFLYRQKIVTLKTAKDGKGKERPATDSGEILWTADKITDYIREHKLETKAVKTLPKSTVTKPPVQTAPKPANNDRYETPKLPPTYKTGSWSDSVIEKVKTLEKNGKKGKECLTEFLPLYNKAKSTSFKMINELNTDDMLLSLIHFIEQQEPEGI